MSFRSNLLATYASQIYTTLIGIVIVPVYIRYMGTEAYGLIGFYAMLQAWFQLLDMGLAPTMSRQTARANGGAIDSVTLWRLLRALERIFIGVAVIGALALGLSADLVASRWLKVEQLPLEQVQLAIQLMAAIIGLRWIAGLYRGAIGGFEQQVWLGQLNAATATARFVLVIPIFIWLGTTPAHFFGYQLLVACIETGLLAAKTYRLMPALPPDTRLGWSLAPLRGILNFSLGIAFTSAVWVLVTQSDKLLLSRLLPLADYAHFTVAVLVASGVSIVSGPLSTALLPRLTRLQAQDDDSGVTRLYRQATQGMAMIALPVALLLASSAESLLLAWTGDENLARTAGPILRLYAIGNGVLALNAFPYYLQFAKGNIRLHLLGNVFFVTLLIPSIVYLTTQYGAHGAGWAWLGSNIVYGAVWVPIVHRKFIPKMHAKWLLQDIVPILACQLAVIAACTLWLTQSHSLVVFLLESIAIFFLTGAAGALASSALRPHLARMIQQVKTSRLSK